MNEYSDDHLQLLCIQRVVCPRHQLFYQCLALMPGRSAVDPGYYRVRRPDNSGAVPVCKRLPRTVLFPEIL
jgi:hypothetical protein